MRVLIFGAAGMLGHKLYQAFRGRHEVWGSIRQDASSYATLELFDPERLIAGVDAGDPATAVRALEQAEPQVVINCVGIVKQLAAARDPIASITINSLFPHRLARLCRDAGCRLIHMSTDCVFSGRKGAYTEDDLPGPEDLYGRSKLLGEVVGEGVLTIRSSIIGRELATSNGLVEWFLAQAGRSVRGYRRAIYSGFTTLAMARIISDIIDGQPGLSGVWHVSSDPLSKYDLLLLVRQAYGVEVGVVPDSEVAVDRSLDSSRFRAVAGFVPPSWPDMIREMAADPTPYDAWRRSHVA